MTHQPRARSAPALTAAERDLLEAFLEDYRNEIRDLVAELTEDEARDRLVPSLTTPLGMLKHLAAVERLFFQRALAGRDPADIDGSADGSDPSWHVEPDDTIASLTDELAQACEESRSVAARHGLDDLARHNWRGPLSLRWIYVHMIEEYARHVGQADILAEQLRLRRR